MDKRRKSPRKKKSTNELEALLPMVVELAVSGIKLLKHAREIRRKRKVNKNERND